MSKNYTTSSDLKKKILQHRLDGIDELSYLCEKNQENDHLRQALHNFFEILDHLK